MSQIWAERMRPTDAGMSRRSLVVIQHLTYPRSCSRSRNMISSIRDGAVARIACGTFAGISTTDCGVVCTSRPPIVRTRTPDSVRKSALNGRGVLRQLFTRIEGKQGDVACPVRASTRLAIPWAVGVTRASNAKSSPGESVLAIAFYSPILRVRSVRPEHVSSATFSARPPAAPADDGGSDLTARSRLRNGTLRANPTHFISASSGFLGLHVRPGFLILETVVVQ